ncbi:lipopolysaccharide transport periplasmic protein LptA [Celeribacter arenosi]|uniref:lipopolysaccharide transport periplasmic protein LptA n=1 Tax=Celeribacter arenosi TaxID=792649 RepID=UPI0031CEDF53
MSEFRKLAFALALAGLLPLASGAIAQGTSVAFGSFQHDSTLPIEVTSDQLSVAQETGKAIFSGNVLVGQGELKLSAGTVEVIYAEDTEEIARLMASGGVTMTNGNEAVEAQSADYDLKSATVTLTGDVILTQGPNAISGERLVIDLETGNGQIDGRVRTILQPGSK